MPEAWETDKARVGWFFRRENWHGKVGNGKPPKWHRLKRVRQATLRTKNALGEIVDRQVIVWEAECGYECKLDRSFQAAPQQLESIKTVSKRCSKCDLAHERRTRELEEGESNE